MLQGEAGGTCPTKPQIIFKKTYYYIVVYCLQVYGHYSDAPFKRLALLGLYIISPLNAIVCVSKYRKLHSASWTSLVRRRHWETEHLPSPDRVSGTAFLLPSVIRHCRRQSSEKFSIFCIKITRF